MIIAAHLFCGRHLEATQNRGAMFVFATGTGLTW